MSTRVYARTAARALSVGLALFCACATPVGGARAANGSHAVESAADWEQAYNAWEERHGAPDRIVAFVGRGTLNGLRVLEVQMTWRTPAGTVKVCGWFAIRGPVRRNPGRQIARDGREGCGRFRQAAEIRSSTVT
jgi:hypothetical protein